jgi:hypothetical protein
MLTNAIITLAKKQFPDWGRELLLQFLNELQSIVFTQSATNQMRMFDTTTGKDPVLSTTQGVYSYDIDTTHGFDDNAWRVTLVYSEDSTDPTDAIFYDATPSVSAKVVFKEDPSTSEYYIRAYRFPSELVTETIQLEIPAAYHLSHVFEGLAGMIEKFRSGKSERYEMFVGNLLPELIKKMSDNHTTNSFTPYRGY